ncbi:N-acetylneuraminate synthase family protein [Hyphomonas sp.]|uniref:N-acetylneuraminate synthase family protein n=1 Tax=Hyphomonas sp. TaxID=87 RepID=UPI001BD11342|nr:N-acetylneuraminate synthase family protein [Hyphomonas sp.]
MSDRQLIVDSVKIGDNEDMYVIAEIGQNHEGDVEKCKALFDSAKLCGAQAVKLQKRDNRSLYTKEYYNTPYNSENAYAPTYGEHREFLEFDRDEWIELRNHSKKIGITLFSTAWDYKSADFLEDLDMPMYKIASGDLKTLPLIKYVASFGKPLFVSTGGASLEDVRRMYDTIAPINPQLCIMQCTSGYPPTFEELNIRVVETYRREFPDIPIGFSSHDSGIAMALLGYMCGARVLEKHFTLNRAWKGTDQAFSLEPNGLRRLIRDLQRARIALGDGIKRTYPSEIAPLIKMGKKIVASRDLSAGHILTLADIAIKSPGDGVAPYFQDVMVGMKLKSSVREDENITFEHLGTTEEAAVRALSEA